jgi:hypothetical protein
MIYKLADFNVMNKIRCKFDIITRDPDKMYFAIPAEPATGLLYVTQNNPEFISGQVRVRGRNNGSYPYNYLEMIDTIFGKEHNVIEVCSGMIKKHSNTSCLTVDINPETNPDLIDDGQTLSSISKYTFNRWRCDPPYNTETARKMFGTDLPAPLKLL